MKMQALWQSKFPRIPIFIPLEQAKFLHTALKISNVSSI